MPSRSRSSSTRRKRSAVTRIQKTLRGKHGRKIAKILRKERSAATRIQTRVRGKQTRKKLSPKTEVILERIKTNIELSKQCPICNEQLIDGVNVLRCGHRFHNECIENALRAGYNNCPLCRTPIVEPEEQEQEEEEEQVEEIRLQIIFIQVQLLENQITIMRQQLPQPPTVPNITLNEALNNQTTAAQIERRVTTNHNEVALYYNNLRTMRQRTRPNWTGADEEDEINQTIVNLYSYTSEVLANAINNTRNASRILVLIGNRYN